MLTSAIAVLLVVPPWRRFYLPSGLSFEAPVTGLRRIEGPVLSHFGESGEVKVITAAGPLPKPRTEVLLTPDAMVGLAVRGATLGAPASRIVFSLHRGRAAAQLAFEREGEPITVRMIHGRTRLFSVAVAGSPTTVRRVLDSVRIPDGPDPAAAAIGRTVWTPVLGLPGVRADLPREFGHLPLSPAPPLAGLTGDSKRTAIAVYDALLLLVDLRADSRARQGLLAGDPETLRNGLAKELGGSFGMKVLSSVTAGDMSRYRLGPTGYGRMAVVSTPDGFVVAVAVLPPNASDQGRRMADEYLRRFRIAPGAVRSGSTGASLMQLRR